MNANRRRQLVTTKALLIGKMHRELQSLLSCNKLHQHQIQYKNTHMYKYIEQWTSSWQIERPVMEHTH